MLKPTVKIFFFFFFFFFNMVPLHQQLLMQVPSGSKPGPPSQVEWCLLRAMFYCLIFYHQWVIWTLQNMSIVCQLSIMTEARWGRSPSSDPVSPSFHTVLSCVLLLSRRYALGRLTDWWRDNPNIPATWVHSRWGAQSFRVGMAVSSTSAHMKSWFLGTSWQSCSS